MKKAVLVFILCLVLSPVFSQEEHRLIIGTGLETEFHTGYFSSDGEITGSPSTPSTFNIPLTIFYRIIAGLEIGVKEGFKLETADTDMHIGIDQPAISLRYTLDFGLGTYGDMYLPVGSEDIVGTDPEIFFNIALFYYVDIAALFPQRQFICSPLPGPMTQPMIILKSAYSPAMFPLRVFKLV